MRYKYNGKSYKTLTRAMARAILPKALGGTLFLAAMYFGVGFAIKQTIVECYGGF